MITDLPHGTFFILRHKGELELWAVFCEQDFCGYTTVKEPLGVGDVIHRCVWKRGVESDVLVSRETYVIQPGDVLWKNTGLLSPVNGKTVYHNVFRNGPTWVREAR